MHNPNNKECHGNHEEYCGEKCDHCTCPEQNMDAKKCMCGEHQLGYFIISERIGETIHSRESPCWVIEQKEVLRDSSGLPVHANGCPQSHIPYANAKCRCLLDFTSPEQKEEWSKDFEHKIGHEDFCNKVSNPNSDDCNCSMSDSLKLIGTYLDLAEERGREEAITYIADHQGWEESEDIYREHFGFPLKYKKS